jgi:tRNA(Ile)-lysidine synthase
MQIVVKPGKYVIAVSGGVDSMVLLDVLRLVPDVRLVIAHLDHGIRDDSKQDRLLVASMAKAYRLPFEYKQAQLGPEVSEADARAVRYDFLEAVRNGHNADAIITAHHQDDVLETALLNMLRGTGRKGLSSLRSTRMIMRPMLHISKQDIEAYAREHAIHWREDSTNQDERYLRNYVRRQLLTRLAADQKQQLADRLVEAASINQELDDLLLATVRSHLSPEGLDRRWFIGLPYDVSSEIMATWLRATNIRSFDKKAIARLVVGAKTALPGKRIDVITDNQLHVGKHYLQLATR